MLLSSGELFLLGAKTSASAHRLPGINFCSSHFHASTSYQKHSTYALKYSFAMPGSETLRALRLLSRSSGGLLSGSEKVTVRTFRLRVDSCQGPVTRTHSLTIYRYSNDALHAQ